MFPRYRPDMATRTSSLRMAAHERRGKRPGYPGIHKTVGCRLRPTLATFGQPTHRRYDTTIPRNDLVGSQSGKLRSMCAVYRAADPVVSTFRAPSSEGA